MNMESGFLNPRPKKEEASELKVGDIVIRNDKEEVITGRQKIATGEIALSFDNGDPIPFAPDEQLHIP